MAKTVTLPSGIEVKLTSVPAMLVLQVLNSLPEPTPPMLEREGTTRTEPNPSDPSYQKALQDHRVAVGRLTNEAYLAIGVLEVVKLGVDSGKFPLESDEWVDLLEFVGVQARTESKTSRKVDWLQYHILGDGDLGEIITQIAMLGGGVTEELVQQAADSFRTEQNGTALTIVSSEAEVRYTDQADFDPRRASE